MRKIVVAIDGANIYATAKMLGIEIDYKRVLRYFGDDLVCPYYYTATKPRNPEEQDNLVPLLDWLSYNGFKLVRKDTKTYIDPSGRTKIKGNMDMELAVDMMELMHANAVTDVWLFSGDGDFRYLIEALQRRGIRVTVVSSVVTTGRDHTGGVVDMPVCSDELRRSANHFVDLAVEGKVFHRQDDEKPSTMRSKFA